MNRLRVAVFTFAAAIASVSPCYAVLVADLKNDYKPATSFGQSSDDVGLPGTVGGSWHYYQDLDGTPVTGNNGLLTWQFNPLYTNSKTGYAGTSGDFGLTFPIISADRLLDGPSPAPPAGHLMGHPAGLQFLAVEYRAHPIGQVDNLSIDYRFERPNQGGTFREVIVSIVRENGTVILAPTPVGAGGVGIAQGTLSGLGSLVPGQGIWLMLGSGGFSDGDQTWLRMALNGDPVAIPEVSGLALLALTMGALVWAGRDR